MKLRRSIVLVGAIACVLVLTGCQHVKPFQRGTLADPVMRADRDSVGDGLNEHIWFSRETATGGRGVGGGGCGCN